MWVNLTVSQPQLCILVCLSQIISDTGSSHFLFVIFLWRVQHAKFHCLVASCPIKEVGINFPLLFLSVHWGSAPYYVWSYVLYEIIYTVFVLYEFIYFVIVSMNSSSPSFPMSYERIHIFYLLSMYSFITWIHGIFNIHWICLLYEFIYLDFHCIHTICEFIYFWFSLNSYNLWIHLFASTHNFLVSFLLSTFQTWLTSTIVPTKLAEL